MLAALYETLWRPLLFRLDPEQAHHVAMFGLRQFARFSRMFPAPRCHGGARTVFGVSFPNPIGLAAGLDKNAVALPAWELLGFGFAEVGTVTARAQPGNPKPRLFRLPEQRALINRMGFNNDGADAVAARLQTLKRSGRWPRIPVGINIGKSKVTPIEEAPGDYLYSFERLQAFADYVVLNVSSPNTPGLRQLQDRASLDELLRGMQEKNAALPAPKPLLLKIAPDLSFEQVDEIVELVTTHRLAGIIATNTTLDHSSVPEAKRQTGGLSGRPLRQRSTEITRHIASRTSLPIIASGGIEDAVSAREKFDAGASLLQLYTGFIYRGPELIREAARC